MCYHCACGLSEAATLVLHAHHAERLDQVDAALILLRHNMIPDVELITGTQVHLCPPSDRLDMDDLQDASDWLEYWLLRHPDCGDIHAWRVTFADPPETTGATARRYSLFRAGRSVRALIDRGVEMADIILGQDHGWLELSPP